MCHEQPLGPIIMLIVALAISCLLVIAVAKGKSAVYSRTMLLSVILLIDLVAPCSFRWFVTLVVIFHLGNRYKKSTVARTKDNRIISLIINNGEKVNFSRLQYSVHQRCDNLHFY